MSVERAVHDEWPQALLGPATSGRTRGSLAGEGHRCPKWRGRRWREGWVRYRGEATLKGRFAPCRQNSARGAVAVFRTFVRPAACQPMFSGREKAIPRSVVIGASLQPMRDRLARPAGRHGPQCVYMRAARAWQLRTRRGQARNVNHRYASPFTPFRRPPPRDVRAAPRLSDGRKSGTKCTTSISIWHRALAYGKGLAAVLNMGPSQLNVLLVLCVGWTSLVVADRRMTRFAR